MRLYQWTMWSAVWLLAAAGLAAQQAPIPRVDELPGQPYVIKNKWVIGGTGDWDYLTLDPTARQLFVTHQSKVQVVDLDTGAVIGEVPGFGNARSVVLDPNGESGYVSDSGKQEIKVFDRRSLQIQKTIPLDCSPRSMTMSAQQQILIAVCGSPVPPETRPNPVRRNRLNRPVLQRPARGDSWIVVIDTNARTVLVYLLVGGDFRIVQSDRDGHVYVTVGPATDNLLELFGTPHANAFWDQSIARVDVPALVEDARLSLEKRAPSASNGDVRAPHWDADEAATSRYVTRFPLDGTCPSPQGLAVDTENARLFVGCDNQNLLVVDSNRGNVLSTLTTGPSTDSIAYDPARKLIFTANGGGYGSLSVIRQHETDSFAVIQTLPTMQQARTMAIDPSTGLVYLVTTLYGADLRNPPVNGIGTLKMSPVDGSFQVLVVGN